MDLSQLPRIAGNAASNIANGALYALGHLLGTVANELLVAVDEAIGGVEWGGDDE